MFVNVVHRLDGDDVCARPNGRRWLWEEYMFHGSHREFVDEFVLHETRRKLCRKKNMSVVSLNAERTYAPIRMK